MRNVFIYLNIFKQNKNKPVKDYVVLVVIVFGVPEKK